MAAERPDSPKTPESPEAAAAAGAPAPTPGARSGGLGAWLPLLVNVLLMPVVAYFTTTLLLVPKLNSGAVPAHGAAQKETGHAEGGAGETKNKITVPLSGKVLVNISGTAGTRYLLANLSLVGFQPNLRELVEKNEAELKDVAAGVLSTKTISDLEKPGARNLIRSELIGVFNNVLGEGAVAELFLTEFAIQ